MMHVQPSFCHKTKHESSVKREEFCIGLNLSIFQHPVKQNMNLIRSSVNTSQFGGFIDHMSKLSRYRCTVVVVNLLVSHWFMVYASLSKIPTHNFCFHTWHMNGVGARNCKRLDYSRWDKNEWRHRMIINGLVTSFILICFCDSYRPLSYAINVRCATQQLTASFSPCIIISTNFICSDKYSFISFAPALTRSVARNCHRCELSMVISG